jgi:hypothetical protein
MKMPPVEGLLAVLDPVALTLEDEEGLPHRMKSTDDPLPKQELAVDTGDPVLSSIIGSVVCPPAQRQSHRNRKLPRPPNRPVKRRLK